MPARILVIDDNPTNLELMLYLLRGIGHHPEGARGALEGLEAARNAEFDLVLSDIRMPEIDGYELARRFKADPKLARTRLVAVTALAMVGDRERVMAAGFDGYIPKPIDPPNFAKQLDKFLSPETKTAARSKTERAERAGAAERTDGPIVLAVDDVDINLDVIAGTLGPSGYRIVRARNGAEGLEKARELKPALILCDVHMPGGHGFDFIEEAKRDPELAEIPFLFISSSLWSPIERARGARLGAVRFLTRPIEPAKLISEVRQAIAGSALGKDPHR